MSEKNKKIIVAMSGGVDSSVAAALMKKRGYDVRGVFMRLWQQTRNYAEHKRGTTRKDYDKGAEENAKAVAKKIGIPLKIFDFKKEFKKAVVNYFLKESVCARTPNPCVVCNQQIKFGLLLDKVMERGGNYIITGHYARIKREFPISNDQFPNKSKIKNPKFELRTAKDRTKDQSYFLYTLTQNKLSKILFPIGDYKKTEVYKMAEEWKLPYKKGESFDICFLAGQSHRDFLKKYLKLKPGKIVDVSGKILGGHRGLPLYTIGQRADIGGPGPFYVVKMNTGKNELVVTNSPRDLSLFKRSLTAENVNWISGRPPATPFKCLAKIRYGHAAVPCIISKIKKQKLKIGNYEVQFKHAQRAITPGQSIVFYRRNEVLGGGVIK